MNPTSDFNFSDLIGFFVVLLVLFIPLLRKLLLDVKKIREKEREKQKRPPQQRPQVVKRQPKPLKPLASSKSHLTSRMVKKDFEFHSNIEQSTDLTDIDERQLQSKVAPEFRTKVTSEAFLPSVQREGRQRSTAAHFLKNKKARQKMVIYSEIFGPPKSLQ